MANRDCEYRSFDFRSGYFQALLDVKNWFDTHSDSLKFLKMYNNKKIPLILQAFIDNRERMMVEGDTIELTIKDGKK